MMTPSSTSLRPPLTLTRRPSVSSLRPQPVSAPPDPQPSPGMIVILASRVLDWLHPVDVWSSPSTPDSPDEYVLPLSASAHQTSFPDAVHEKVLNHYHWFHLPSPGILIVISLFPLSTALLFLVLRTLPISFSWPSTIAEVAELGRVLTAYSQSGPLPLAHVFAVMSVTAIWKHAWSIPGSVLWNVLAGALWSPAPATLLLTFLTMIGSVCASLLAAPLAPVLTRLFPRALEMTRSALEGSSQNNASASEPASPPWVRLSVLRLIGIVPWSGINIACGVCGVEMSQCMLGAFIGTLPWTAVTCQIGDILQTVASTPSPTPQTVSSLLLSPAIIIKLVLLSFLSLAPILARDRLRRMISPSIVAVKSSVDVASHSVSRETRSEKVRYEPSHPQETDLEQRPSRWTSWVPDLDRIRSQIRMSAPSSSRSRERRERERRRQRELELAVLVQEKRAIEDEEEGLGSPRTPVDMRVLS